MHKIEHLTNPKSMRGKEWRDFAILVAEHLEEYTIPQYGDYPNDQMTEASLEDIKMNIERYKNRMTSNARGLKESIRDLYKIAHYAAIIWGKYNRNEIQSAKTYAYLVSAENKKDRVFLDKEKALKYSEAVEGAVSSRIEFEG